MKAVLGFEVSPRVLELAVRVYALPAVVISQP
jgi:hypothetical protein